MAMDSSYKFKYFFGCGKNNQTRMSILTLNGGSSSLKFALYSTKDARANTKGKLTPIFSGSVERINLKDTQLVWHTKDNDKKTESLGKQDRDEAAKSLLDWLEKRPEFEKVEGVAHRVVHGGLSRTETQKVTKSLVKQLKDAADFAPEHMPLETALMQAILDKHPKLLQVACFDTSFHSSMPRVASLLPLPRRYDKKGVRKYGFHGVSYAFLLEELALELGVDAKKTGHVILAHLGNGASMCAVRNGVSVDTSMSFTPTAGLVMSTRSGDLDPGVFAFLHHTEKMSADDFAKLVNKESGLVCSS
jgi:acetate kinase